FPAAAADDLQQVAGELNTDLAGYGLDSTLRLAHFFAQVRQESGPELKAAIESLAYSPEVLVRIFGYYKAHPAEATQAGYDRDPGTGRIRRAAAQETIANKAYANRNGNGDIASGDGWRYRGRGLIQVTGRCNYEAISKQCRGLYPGMDVDFVAHPDPMATFPGTVRSAVGFWTLHGLPRLADMGRSDADVDRITKVINPGMAGAPARRADLTPPLPALRQ